MVTARPPADDIAAALAAGTGPAHGTPLSRAGTGDDSTGGLCAACGRYWWHDPGTSQAGSFSARSPFAGTPMPSRGESS
jgi:hypothetical protein